MGAGHLRVCESIIRSSCASTLKRGLVLLWSSVVERELSTGVGFDGLMSVCVRRLLAGGLIAVWMGFCQYIWSDTWPFEAPLSSKTPNSPVICCPRASGSRETWAKLKSFNGMAIKRIYLKNALVSWSLSSMIKKSIVDCAKRERSCGDGLKGKELKWLKTGLQSCWIVEVAVSAWSNSL